jgi:hypothetical protein
MLYRHSTAAVLCFTGGLTNHRTDCPDILLLFPSQFQHNTSAVIFAQAGVFKLLGHLILGLFFTICALESYCLIDRSIQAIHLTKCLFSFSPSHYQTAADQDTDDTELRFTAGAVLTVSVGCHCWSNKF